MKLSNPPSLFKKIRVFALNLQGSLITKVLVSDTTAEAAPTPLIVYDATELVIIGCVPLIRLPLAILFKLSGDEGTYCITPLVDVGSISNVAIELPALSNVSTVKFTNAVSSL